MRLIPLFPLLLLLLTSSARAGLPLADSQGAPLPSLAPMLERSVPAVVNIFTRTRVPVRQSPLFSDPFFRRFFDIPEQPRERITQSLGSGVIVDAAKGYLLTNHHVIDGADEIAVHLNDKRTLQATLLGSDPETDIALLQVKAEGLSALKLGDSDQLRVGDFVVAIGNPFGLGQTVTSGIVSALGRSGLGIEGYEDFIQTDASINPGNSGGALVNLRGDLVGLNTAILSKSGGNVGIGFAIPSNMVNEVVDHLQKHGKVLRGQLGAEAQDLTPELAAAFGLKGSRGAVVTQVNPDSAAAKAGMVAGDVIVEVNGRSIGDSADVRNAIGLLRIGETVTLKVQRDNRIQSLRAVIRPAESAAVDAAVVHPRLAGAELLPAKGGLMVAAIAEGSPAQQVGLRRGDLLTQVNRVPVTTIAALQQLVSKGSSLLINLRRGNSALFIFIN